MRHLIIDTLLLLISIAVAVVMVQTDFVHVVLGATGDRIVLACFIAGVFFTSLFTTPPAIAVLAELALIAPASVVVLAGAFGAMVGDSLLFLFVRERVADDAEYILRGSRMGTFFLMLRRRHFRRVLPVVGALIIASPLPDEFGLALLGVSGISTRAFLLLSYCMNAFGILLIVLAARALG